MEKRKELIDYILKNGKTHTWYELGLMFNIRPGASQREISKAANDTWRNYERKENSTKKPNTTFWDVFQNTVEEFLIDKPSFISKPSLDAAKAFWKIIPEKLTPKNIQDLEKQLLIIKQVQSDLRKAKVLKISEEQQQLIDVYNEIVNQKEKSIKKLFFDIETSPNIVFSWRVGRKINIDYENIISERAIICISYKWEGEDKVHSLKWENGDDREMLRLFSQIIDSADQIVTQNGDKFDIKWLRARCIYHGIPISPKFNSIDTLKLAKAGFNFNSNKLDYMGEFLGVGNKIKTEYSLWKRIILNNDENALSEMIAYCEEDVRLLERVYNKLQPYCPIKPFKYIKK